MFVNQFSLLDWFVIYIYILDFIFYSFLLIIAFFCLVIISFYFFLSFYYLFHLLWQKEKYIVTYNPVKRNVYALLKDQAKSDDILKAAFHVSFDVLIVHM